MTAQSPIPVPEWPDGVRGAGMALWKQPPENFTDVFKASVRNEKSAASDEQPSKVATLRLYGPIYDGWFGVSAKAVSAALDQVGDVEEIRVRLNSPGGDVAEATTILNMLRAHGARVVAVVDGLAASSASFLAAGCDETVMSPGTQMMVHDASGICLGRAKDMRKMAEALDSFSNSIASIYAEATGGSTSEWRDVMLEETWYTAEEAVTAGLADRTGVVKDAGKTETAETDDADLDCDFEDRVAARFDLSVFNHAGREHAPAPKHPTATAGGPSNTEGGPAVAFSDAQLTTMRAKLELPADADEAAITAALVAVVEDSLEDGPTASTPPSGGQPAPAPAPAAAPTQPVATAPGTMVIDSSSWDAQQDRIKNLEAADARRRRDERDQVINQAVADGKFLAARKDHWTRLWDADPEGTRTVIDGLTSVVPVNEIGHADDEGDFDEFAHLYPKGA